MVAQVIAAVGALEGVVCYGAISEVAQEVVLILGGWDGRDMAADIDCVV